ncbi:MAG: hypothetical protein GY773_10805 [Actinomycetia bacterium]|nr:hypothetical protein [Actinomycetes bacterium]
MSEASRPPPTRFDPFLSDSKLRHAYQLLHAGNWDELDKVLSRAPGSWLLPPILTSEDAAIESVVLVRYVKARPSCRSLSLLAGLKVRDAFEAHSVEDATTFTTQLQRAEKLLHDAMHFDPQLADPWVHLLHSGRGLNIDLRDLRHRFESAHELAPFRPDACRQYLLGLSSRSGGSDDAMFDFARWIRAEAPSGSPAMGTLPTAHLEYCFGHESPVSLTEHLTHPATVAELTPALADYMWANPSQAGPAELPTLNAFALAMTVSDRETALLVRGCFRRIDNRPTSYPWSLYQDEEIAEVFNEVQRAQLRSADRFAP